MVIKIKKFGTTLTSRQDGREAFNAFLPNLKNLKEKEKIIVDFEGVITFTPSWGDEFLTNLGSKVGKDNLVFVNTDNPSVKATLDFLDEISNSNILE